MAKTAEKILNGRKLTEYEVKSILDYAYPDIRIIATTLFNIELPLNPIYDFTDKSNNVLHRMEYV